MSDLSDADHEREQARLLDNFAVRDLDSDYSGSASDLDTSSGERDDGVPVQHHGFNIDSGASPDDSDIDRSADESDAYDAAVPYEGFATDDGTSEPSILGTSSQHPRAFWGQNAVCNDTQHPSFLKSDCNSSYGLIIRQMAG